MFERSGFEAETSIENTRRHKSSGIDKIPAELITAGGRNLHSEIHKLIVL